jgi:integrase
MPVLTVAALRKYVAGSDRREIRDTLAPSLYLIIQPKPKATRSWAMRFRRPDGRPAKLTLGRVDLTERETEDEPTLGGALTLRQARELANRIDRERARGIDVIERVKADKARAASASAVRSASGFGRAARDFFADYKTQRLTRVRRWSENARTLGLDYPADADPAKTEPDIIPGGLAATWADRPVAEIDGHDIHATVDDARRNGIPGLPRKPGVSETRGRRMHSALSNLFRYLLQHRKVALNPAAGVWRPGPPPARERVLTEAEIKALWRASETLRAPYGAAVRLLLLTGARLDEVSGMRRDELSNDNSSWTIPGSRTKNHRALTLPLPPLARAVIAATSPLDGSPFVFATLPNRAVTSWSRAKAELDAASGVTGWRLHDLRRTAATGMAEIGIAPHIIEAVLNHVSGHKGGVAGIYNRARYAPEMKAALERWAAHIERLVAERPAKKVVPIRGGGS